MSDVPTILNWRELPKSECTPLSTPKEAERLSRRLLRAFNEGSLGLAAPQIGESGAAVVCRTTRGIITMINPVVVFTGEETFESREACLSIPDEVYTVARPTEITVFYQNPKLEARKLHFAKDIEKEHCQDISVVCHEVDHLKGITIRDVGKRGKIQRI